MKNKPIKILFDNSVLNEELINLFNKNNILYLKNKDFLRFYVSDMTFHENIIELSYIEKEKIYYNKLVKFLIQYADNNFFRKIFDVIEYELNNKNLDTSYFLYPETFIKQFKDDFNKGLVNWDNIIENHRRTINDNVEIYKNYKKFIRDTEIEISKLKSNNDFNNYIETVMSNENYFNEWKTIIRNDLNTLKLKEKIIKFLQWRFELYIIDQFSDKFKVDNKFLINNLKSKPYLQRFLGNILYSFTFKFENITKDKCVDITFNDNEYIACMLDLDILLSNDVSYMKHCFEDIYKNTNKKILKSNDFIEYLKDLQYIK